MLANIRYKEKVFEFDLEKAIDISIPINFKANAVNAFYAPKATAEPVRMGDFVGSTLEGSPVNFYNVQINPHGNGTHTECVGHISKEKFSINKQLKQFFAFAKLISIAPEKQENGDLIITKQEVLNALDNNWDFEALVLRTLPNTNSKLSAQYSGTNPAYLSAELLAFLAKKEIKHLLLDLPSVDREEDGGKLAGHKAFWQYPEKPRLDATITEMIYVPNDISDGDYLLNLQICSLELDAAPSKPVLYKITSPN